MHGTGAIQEAFNMTKDETDKLSVLTINMPHKAQIVEEAYIDGKNYRVIWRDLPFLPPRDLTEQASGICFTSQGDIVLVSGIGESWMLPGGHPEAEETLEQAFIREVREEACALVNQSAYIGCQEVHEIDGTHAVNVHFSARNWASVTLEQFLPKCEIVRRKCIPASEFISTLNWSTVRCAEAILEAGLREEKDWRSR